MFRACGNSHPACDILRPRFHDWASSREEITAKLGELHRVSNPMGQTGLGNLAVNGRLTAPVPKRRTHSVRYTGNAKLAKNGGERASRIMRPSS